jgi:rare lipoprotein A
VPKEAPPAGPFLQIGLASWYGSFHAGQRTASGEPFDPDAMTAAHRTLPLGALVRVTNVANGRSVTVRINDRGPRDKGRIIDLSRGAAQALGFTVDGVMKVKLERLSPD